MNLEVNSRRKCSMVRTSTVKKREIFLFFLTFALTIGSLCFSAYLSTLDQSPQPVDFNSTNGEASSLHLQFSGFNGILLNILLIFSPRNCDILNFAAIYYSACVLSLIGCIFGAKIEERRWLLPAKICGFFGGIHQCLSISNLLDSLFSPSFLNELTFFGFQVLDLSTFCFLCYSFYFINAKMSENLRRMRYRNQRIRRSLTM